MSLTEILSIPYLPIAQFWFLYALLWMYLAYTLFQAFGRFFLYALLFCSIILLFFPVRTDILALGGFSTGFVFFVIGVFARRQKHLTARQVPLWAAMIVLLLFMGSGYYIFTHLIEPVRLPGGTYPLYYIWLAVLGITFCTGLAQFLAGKRYAHPVKVLGVYSLEIYLIHMLAGVGARIILASCSVSNPLVHMVVGVAAGLSVPIVIFKVSQKLNFPYLFNPVRLSARQA